MVIIESSESARETVEQRVTEVKDAGNLHLDKGIWKSFKKNFLVKIRNGLKTNYVMDRCKNKECQASLLGFTQPPKTGLNFCYNCGQPLFERSN